MKNRTGFENKFERYNSLRRIIAEINQDLSIESIAAHLTFLAFSLITNNKGNCILYLVDTPTQKLTLFKTKKEDHNLVIKAKEGDIFDAWVIKHASPLIIEDVRKDFRFDLDKLKTQETRSVSSLISAPFISEHKFLGLLRLDNSKGYSYTQDDLRFLVTICDIGAIALENGQLFKKTEDLAIHDGLTSLYTKTHFLELLKSEYRKSARQNRAFSLLMLDIDYFKNYNDKFGHTAGDIVLKELSQKIVNSLKDFNPIVSRFGGEEFCIILSDMDKEEAYKLAEKLRAEIEKTKIVLRRKESNITVSIGVASFPDQVNGEDDLIFKADRAMYEAKEKGRNRVCIIQ